MKKVSCLKILELNYDYDIDPSNKKIAQINNFSHQVIPYIINDDSNGFNELVSNLLSNSDEQYKVVLKRFCLIDYLYQRFFDHLTTPSILCVAAFFKAKNIVDFLLDLPDIDKKDSFHYACAGGSIEIVRVLYDANVVDKINKNEIRPMNIAAYFGNLDVVKFLYSKGCEIISKEDVYSSVNKAAFNGNINVLYFFIENDENIFKKLKNFGHPIISAAKGGQPNCIKYFINLGVSKSLITSALEEACKNGSLSCVKILVKEYLSSKSKSKDGQEIPITNNASQKNKSLPKSVYNAAINGMHFDVLQYLLKASNPQSMLDLLISALEQEKISVKMAKFILNHCTSNIFDDEFFDKVQEKKAIKNTLILFNEINFQIKNEQLSDSQISFFRQAVLNANLVTLPILIKILKNCQIDLFLSENYEQLMIDAGKSTEKSNIEKRREMVLEETFKSYFGKIVNKNFEFRQRDYTNYFKLLISVKFPYLLIYRLDLKMEVEISSYLYKALIEMGKFYDARYFIISPCFGHLISLFIKAQQIFNKSNCNTKKIHFLNKGENAMIYYMKFNERKEREKQPEFNIFQYECENAEEEKVYNDYMSLMKCLIKKLSNDLFTPILLIKNGLNKEWIINQMIEKDDDEINPLFNIMKMNINKIKNTKLKLQIIELIKYYLINGIDVSSTTFYAEKIWKYIIDNKEGYFAYLLIQYGNADNEFLLTKNVLDDDLPFDSISLIDYALFKKAVNIIFIFFNSRFYPQKFIADLDTDKLIDDLINDEYGQYVTNLKIIALLYKFIDDDYDKELKKEVINELKSLMKK